MTRLPKWMLEVMALALLVGLAMPALANQAKNEEAKGTIKSVAADKDQFVLTDKDKKDWTFDLDEKAKVSVNDKAGKLTDLKPGDEVTVTYEKKGAKMIAKEVRAKR